MSPSPLHPRSTAPSTLFASTLAASFIIVAIPHLFPCPVRPVRDTYDSDGRPLPQQQRRTRQTQISIDPMNPSRAHTTAGYAQVDTVKEKTLQDEALLFRQMQDEASRLDVKGGECPIPKPTGFLGQMLGFEDGRKQSRMQKRWEMWEAEGVED